MDTKKGDQGDPPVEKGQTVRIDYVASLDDGAEVARATASFRIGQGQVCEAIDVGIDGMRVGDRRRIRSPPFMRRSNAIEASVPQGEQVEYNVLLTGAVHHMQIVTIDKPGFDDPLTMVWEFGKRLLKGSTKQ